MRYIIGIDEVGRGSLAGPITVAALAIPKDLRLASLTKFKVQSSKFILPLRDSKKLTPKQRWEWFSCIRNHPSIFWDVAHVQPSVIDRINIARAANRAASRALLKLVTNYKLPITQSSIFLDGGLYLDGWHRARTSQNSNKTQNLQSTRYKLGKQFKARTIVRADEKVKAVMLASITAKVIRDRLMCRLHKKFPRYGFDLHKGYGTKAHMAAVRKFGPSRKHRITFLT